MLLSRQLARRAFQRVPRRWTHSPAGLAGLNSVTEEDLAHFATILPASSILSTLPSSATPSSELEPFNNDWMNKYHGQSTTVLKPRNVQEVSEIVKWCNQRRIGIVPQGGNTGLVGGGVPVRDEVIVSLANMSKVRSFDDVSGAYGNPLTVRLLITTFPLSRYLGCGRRVHTAVAHRLSRATSSYCSTRPRGEGQVRQYNL